MKIQSLMLPLLVAFVINLGFFLPLANADCVDPPSGLVGWWPGDGSGDDIIGPNDGVLQSGATFSSGMVGQAFSFDGIDDYVHATQTNIQDLQQLTISLWVKHDSLPAGQVMRYVTMEGEEKAVLRYDGAMGTRQLHFYMKINGLLRHIRVNNVLQVGVFHHVAGTYDGSVMRLYLDGSEIGNYAVSGTVSPCYGVGLGAFPSLDGLLDEVQIYNRALSHLEIQGIFAAGSEGNCKPNPDDMSFNVIEVYSDNRADLGWRLSTDFILNNAVSPAVSYSVNGGSPNNMSRVTAPYYKNVYLYDGCVTDQVGGSPADYNGSTFTWTADDTENDLSATATVSSGIRQIPLSTNLTISGDPVHPTVSWSNPDPKLNEYRVRVIAGDLSQGWVWQTSLPYSSYGANPTYKINDFTFEPGTEYWIRIEAREYFYLPFDAGSSIPSPTTSLLMTNRSTVIFPYTFGKEVSFNYIEVLSDNRQDLGWQLKTDLIVNNADSPTVTYSVDGSSFYPLSRVTIPFYQNVFLYDAEVTRVLGGSPADYNGSTFTWTVDDTNDLTATGTVPSGIRQIPLSTNLTISGDPVHPVVSWHNPDPNLDQYTVRVIEGDLSQGWVWQTSLPYSSYGANPTYTINAFTFEPGVDYWIRIEAREWLNFPFAAGSDLPAPTTSLQLLNRSTVIIGHWIKVKGDFNGDRLVNIADAVIALRSVAGVQVENARYKNEINGDGRVGLEDAAYVLQCAANLRYSPDTDNDSDGLTENQGDCNDNDPKIKPGAVEICGDGIDQDCNGSDLSCLDVDNDGDGFTENQGDCNDAVGSIHPGATEICGDGIDQDCNGSDLPCPPPCTNIAGYWDASETVNLTCCLGGECESETFSGSDSVMIEQNVCNISYEISASGYGTFTRVGTIDGNSIHLSGQFVVLQPWCTATQNSVDITGTVNGDQINLQGSGIVSGTCDGQSFQCTGTSTGTLTR